MAAVSLSAVLAACGSIQVRPLATGVQDRPAYALAGPSLDGLRDEARRLCPAGADVLRSAQRIDGGHAVRAPSSDWYGRWWQKTQLTLAPANGQAQLVVLCQPVDGRQTLAALPSTPAQPAAGNAAAETGGTEAPLTAARSGDLRGGMTAALPTAAVSSGRPGRAPSAAAVPGQSRIGAAAAASAPILRY